MIKNNASEILYEMYFYKFMKETRKDDDKINWTKWNFLNNKCNKYYNLMVKGE